MRTPARHVVPYAELKPGDYILAERKGKGGLADARQGTVRRVVPEYGVVLEGSKFLVGVGPFAYTFVLVESQADREETLRKLKEN